MNQQRHLPVASLAPASGGHRPDRPPRGANLSRRHQSSPASLSPALPQSFLHSVGNATVLAASDGLHLARQSPAAPITLTAGRCQVLGLSREHGQWFVLPLSASTPHIAVNHSLWLLPLDPSSPDLSWNLTPSAGSATATATPTGLTVVLTTGAATLHPAEARPHSDPFGHRFAFNLPHGPELESTLATFYWGTILSSVVEKTFAAHFPYS